MMLDQLQRGNSSRNPRANEVSTLEATAINTASFATMASASMVQQQSIPDSRRVVTVVNPLETLSVYEPGGPQGCKLHDRR
jgi:hypothetical protein